MTTPSGCAWCGVSADRHFSRWAHLAGHHAFVPPTDEQILRRMLARRSERRRDPATMAEAFDVTLREVRRHGWALRGAADSPVGPYLYTCGITPSYGLPELAIIGVDPDAAWPVLAAMATAMRDGTLPSVWPRLAAERIPAGRFTHVPLRLGPVHPTWTGLFPFAVEVAAEAEDAWGPSILQVVHPDPCGLWPGQERYQAGFQADLSRRYCPEP